MFDRFFNTRPKMRLVWFIALVCLATLVLFQKPLLTHAISVSDLPNFQGVAQIATLQMLQICLLAFLLFAVSLLSSVVLKLVTSALFGTNAVALYYMLNYRIEFDRTMIGNILGTDTREATELFHPSIIPYVLLLGLVPIALIWRTKIIMPRWYWRVIGSAASIAVLFVWILATSFTWLWFDQNATRMGSKILPWSYIVNTARHFNRIALDEREQIPLPDGTFAEEPEQKEVVVLIIGEAARADHWSHYGYERDTNAFTEQQDVSILPIGQSCATNTISSTACIVTSEGSQASSHTSSEPIQSYLTRHDVETVFRTNNSGPPPVAVDLYERAGDIAARCTDAPCPNGKLDEALNWGLKEYIQGSDAKRIFVTLHQTGSHGPAYSTKYPDAFETYTPVCDTVQIANCSQEELTNAYDNTLRYSNSLIADVISMLDSLPDTRSVMLYTADHGQSLGEGGFYLHGAPLAIAPREQRIVPFMVWMSDAFKSARGLTTQSIITAESFPHDFPFHSIMGAFGMTSPIYKPQFDVFNMTDEGPAR